MKNISLDYRYLKAFLITARELNFSKAAIELNIAQSAVSRQIKLLEESIQSQLIIRSSKKVLLTDEGQSLYDLICNFEKKIQDVFFSEHIKIIRVGILHGLLETWFNEIITEFSKKNKYQISIEINALEKLKERLINGRYDIIFSTENIQSEIVTSLRLFEEKMVLVSKNDISAKDAYQYPWIVYSEQDHLFNLYKKQSEKIIIINSITSIIKLVQKNVGIAILPEHSLPSNHNLKTYELKNLPKNSIYLSTLNYQHMPIHLKDLINVTSNHKL